MEKNKSQQDTRKSIKCEYCHDHFNLPTNIFCQSCTMPLIKLRWIHFFILLISISSIGFLIGYYRYDNIWIASIILELIVLSYVLMILRHESTARNHCIFLSFLVLQITIISSHGFYIISPLNLYVGFLIFTGIVYLVVSYLLTHFKICGEHGITIIKGFSVLSLSMFVFFILINIIIDYAINSYMRDEVTLYNIEINLSEISSFLKIKIKIREILFVITIIQIMFLALVNVVKKEIPRPDPLFKSSEMGPIEGMKKSSKSSILTLLYNILTIIGNTFIYFYNIVSIIIKTTLNTIKIVIEYILKFIWYYAMEILKTINSFIIVFLKINFKFFKKHSLPLFLFLLISIQVDFLIKNIWEYTHTGFFGPIIFNILLIYVGLIIFIWGIASYRFTEIFNCMILSNTSFILILSITTLISSWILWGISQFIERLPFKEVGHFTKYGSIIILLSLIIIFIYSLVRPDLFKKEDKK